MPGSDKLAHECHGLYGHHCALMPHPLHHTASSSLLRRHAGNVKITDFGVSRMKMTTYLKTEQFTAGTIPYMAPECYQSTNVTEKCDIYSLGMILWECISGMHPWEGLNGMAVMYHVGCLKVRQRPSSYVAWLGFVLCAAVRVSLYI
jgi:serine/threonine protein kinase